MPLTMDDRWDNIQDTLGRDARLIAWDTCHKIYVAVSDEQADWFRTHYHTVEGTPEDMLATLHKWWDESCWLRFISAVGGTEADPEFTDLISQFDDEDEWTDEDD
jgi:hypothetical protein